MHTFLPRLFCSVLRVGFAPDTLGVASRHDEGHRVHVICGTLSIRICVAQKRTVADRSARQRCRPTKKNGDLTHLFNVSILPVSATTDDVPTCRQEGQSTWSAKPNQKHDT